MKRAVETAASPSKRALRALWKNRAARIAAAMLGLLGILCFGSPLLSALTGVSPEAQDLHAQYESPSARHWFGTDLKGRDILMRVFDGGRISFLVGIVATLVSLVIGVSYGAIAGYAGSRIDQVMMRFVDVLYGLPFMFFVILLLVVFGRQGDVQTKFILLFVALGAVQWLTMARIVRGQVLSLKEHPFIEAAISLGARPIGIVTRHMLPNLVGPVIVYATLTVPAVMLEEAFLSFLGLGVEPPQASWGVLIADGAAALNPVRITWWLVAFPAGALALTLLCLNLLGDGLRDAFDPQRLR